MKLLGTVALAAKIGLSLSMFSLHFILVVRVSTLEFCNPTLKVLEWNIIFSRDIPDTHFQFKVCQQVVHLCYFHFLTSDAQEFSELVL